MAQSPGSDPSPGYCHSLSVSKPRWSQRSLAETPAQKVRAGWLAEGLPKPSPTPGSALPSGGISRVSAFFWFVCM